MLVTGKSMLIEKMANKLIKEDVHLSVGDIIKVKRIGYWHVGVYIGDHEVIHFSSLKSDISSKNNKIIKTSLKQFLKGRERLEKVKFSSDDNKDDPLEFFFRDFRFYNPDYKLYPAHEVVERAKSRLGEMGYDLKSNNCEHFAIWCKTGISKSRQIDLLIQKLFPL